MAPLIRDCPYSVNREASLVDPSLDASQGCRAGPAIRLIATCGHANGPPIASSAVRRARAPASARRGRFHELERPDYRRRRTDGSRAQEPLACAARFRAECERPLAGAVHVGAHVLRLVAPDFPGR